MTIPYITERLKPLGALSRIPPEEINASQQNIIKYHKSRFTYPYVQQKFNVTLLHRNVNNWNEDPEAEKSPQHGKRAKTNR